MKANFSLIFVAAQCEHLIWFSMKRCRFRFPFRGNVNKPLQGTMCGGSIQTRCHLGDGSMEFSYVSRLRACGPVIPGIPRLAGDDPATYTSGRYGDQVRYGDGILFLFVGGHTH